MPVERLRCGDTPFARIQGFAGREIEHFPPFRFFTMSLEDRQAAVEDFTGWMRHCLYEQEAWRMPKRSGGWKGGSLMRTVRRLHEERGIELVEMDGLIEELVEQAIHLRVEYYLRLFESIRLYGLSCWSVPPISCVLRQDAYELVNGHHRTAALVALGSSHVRVKVVRGG